MKILKRYKNGNEYVTGGMVSIEPSGVEPVEQFDLSALTKEEFKQLMKNKKDKNLLKKARKIDG